MWCQINEDKLISYLQSACKDHKLSKFNSNVEEKFNTRMGYDTKFDELETFTMEINTNWIMYKMYGNKKGNVWLG